MRQKIIIAIVLILSVGVLAFVIAGKEFSIKKEENTDFKNNDLKTNSQITTASSPVARSVANINPSEVKAVYLTSWSFISQKKRNTLIKLAENTEINSFVINIKDSDGASLFSNIKENDLLKLIDELHQKNIYLIGRIAVFQDKYLIKNKPELSLKYSDGRIWRDQGGYYWLDPASREVWDYTINLSKKGIDFGLDEIQLDYIRFPSEGSLEKVVYPFYDGKTKKSEIINNFMAYFDKEIEKYNSKTIISADIFGYTFMRGDDLGIGQILNDILKHFDYVSPMVYPSHYKSGNFGFKNPAQFPYEVIKGTLEKGIEVLAKANIIVPTATVQPSITPSSSVLPSISPELSVNPTPTFDPKLSTEFKAKIRPWLQDFNLGATYDADKIKAQKKAVYDFGVNTWMFWNPSNVYTSGGFEK